MSVSPVASSPNAAIAPLPSVSPDTPAAVSDAGSTSDPAVQVSLSAEATLTLSVYQETRISISAASSGPGSSNSDATDPETARALATLKAVDAAERAWAAEIKARNEGRPAPKADDANATSPKASAATSATATSGLQVSVEQETVVQASLQVGAEVDVRA